MINRVLRSIACSSKCRILREMTLSLLENISHISRIIFFSPVHVIYVHAYIYSSKKTPTTSDITSML